MEEKLNDVRNEDGNYQLGNTIYDRTGEVVDVIEDNNELREMQNEEVSRLDSEKKYN